uniref:FMRFamide n=4 Tax=Lophotrochozoa TaxID=1206795 RepID=FMRF_ALIVI
FMRF